MRESIDKMARNNNQKAALGRKYMKHRDATTGFVSRCVGQIRGRGRMEIPTHAIARRSK